jgi:putative redox protein
MATIKTIVKKDLRTEITHLRSGSRIMTDAPVDNHGKGEYFSPTDLLSASLGSCMTTIMEIAGREHGFSIEGTEIIITKIMSENPRKIAEIVVELNFPPNNYSDKVKKIIEITSRTCPVALSLHPDLKQTVLLKYS